MYFMLNFQQPHYRRAARAHVSPFYSIVNSSYIVHRSCSSVFSHTELNTDNTARLSYKITESNYGPKGNVFEDAGL